MFGSPLRDLDGSVAQVDYLLPYPVHFVAENQRIALFGLVTPVVQHDGAFDLFDGQDRIPLRFQFVHRIRGIPEIRPLYGRFGSQRGLVDLPVGRGAGDPAQAEPFDGESVAGAEKRACVIAATHVVQHDRDGTFFHRSERFGRRTPQFLI